MDQAKAGPSLARPVRPVRRVRPPRACRSTRFGRASVQRSTFPVRRIATVLIVKVAKRGGVFEVRMDSELLSHIAVQA